MTDTHAEATSSVTATRHPPPGEFAAQANATADLYRRAEADRLS